MKRITIISSIAAILAAIILAGCGGGSTGTADAPKLLATTTASTSDYGYQTTSASSVQFYVNNAPWADIHYIVNGGAQMNVRMTVSGANNLYTLSGLKAGDVVKYFFTIGISTGGATDTAWAQFTMGTTTTPTGPAGYTFCANENGTCTLSGTNSVAYGANGSFFYKTITGSTACNNSVFGDPIAGTVKACFYKATQTGTWNGLTTFNMTNGTNGAYPDSQVYWAIIGKDWNTGKFVHVDSSGHLIPMSLNDNGALTKNGQTYTNYFYSLAQTKSITIPAINSARLFISVGSPMYIKVNSDINGNIGYAGPNIENPSDPNINVYFDFVEMAIVPSSGLYANTTRVDQFGFPVLMHVQGLNGFDQTVGETETRAALFQKFVAEVPSQFQGLAQAPYAPYRIMAPAHATFNTGGSNSTYLDSYISAIWQKYATQTLTFTDQQGTFTGQVVNGKFQFTDGQGTYYINSKPTTAMALLGNGALSDATGTTPGTPAYDKQLQIQAQMCAAINRHIVEDPAHWSAPSYFYPAGQLENYYSKFWHDHSVNRLSYGFAYDDVWGQSSSVHTTAPTAVTVTVGW
jgi:hypothetical protein